MAAAPRPLLSSRVMSAFAQGCEPPVSSGQSGFPNAAFGVLWARARIAIWRRRFALAAAGLSALVLGAALTFASWYMAQDARLAVVHFPTSCGWQSQREFTTATALLHLFQFADAEQAYRSLVERDPDCAIGNWGIAMSRLQNPLYALPSSEDEDIARQALAAAAAARNAGARERAYLAAAATLFDAHGRADWHAREVAYARAMERVVAQYPQDREAVIFYALALNLTAATDDKTKAAELLLIVFSEEPDHPGIDHYLTYCLGHAAYQPKPFERATVTTPIQRILLAAFALFALCSLGIFVTLTADLRPGAGSAGRFGGPFMLTAADGTMVTDRSFRGRWLLVYFGYTRCPSDCPAALSRIADAIERLEASAARVQPIFVTIDPERDTPEIVGKFTRAFDPRIVGLTGKPAEIAALAKQYRVSIKKVPGDDVDHYRMEHSSYVYVIGPDGRYVTLFSHTQAQAPEGIASRLRELLSPSSQQDERNASGNIGTRVAGYGATQ
jgi:protein SCO1